MMELSSYGPEAVATIARNAHVIERQWDSYILNPENIGASENRGSCLVQSKLNLVNDGANRYLP